MAKALVMASIVLGICTLAWGQTASAPLAVTATVVSICTVKVPRRVDRIDLSTMPVDIACARGGERGGAAARVERPPTPQRSVEHAVLVINF